MEYSKFKLGDDQEPAGGQATRRPREEGAADADVDPVDENAASAAPFLEGPSAPTLKIFALPDQVLFWALLDFDKPGDY